MIRRDVTTDNGQPAWLLISQVEHARLSGELAEHWIGAASKPAAALLPLVCRDELLPAIYRHDDGWADWEQAPDVDPQTGRPLTFTEMPLEVALDIWRASVERAQEIGPLAAWVVASHFSSLLGNSHEAQKPLAIDWLAEFKILRDQWLIAWKAAKPVENTLQQAETSLHQLQFFDLLSLWLCMAERTTAHEFATSGGGAPLTLSPQPNSTQIKVWPWPFKTGALELSTTGRLVPARAYQDRAALAAVPFIQISLQWHLVPKE